MTSFFIFAASSIIVRVARPWVRSLGQSWTVWQK